MKTIICKGKFLYKVHIVLLSYDSSVPWYNMCYNVPGNKPTDLFNNAW